MVSHRAFGKMQPPGNLPVGEPLGDQPQDIHLALGEFFGQQGRGLRLVAGDLMEQFPFYSP